MGMDFRRDILATFEGTNRNIVWQPRLEHWFNVNKTLGRLPERFKDVGNILDIYRDLGASVRYFYGESVDISSPRTYILFEYFGGAAVEEVTDGDEIHVYFRSPLGTLHGCKKLGEWGCSWHYIEHPVKKLEDLEILEYVVTHTRYRFNEEFFQEAKAKLDGLGEIQFYWERSPFQRLFLQFAGIETTIALVHDYPERLKEYLRKAEEAEDGLFEILASCPVRILNFGENIDGRFDSPRIFEEWLLPYYEKRVAQLHKAGKFCHIHMDGSLKPLLPYLKDLPFDGIEAPTPLPQGDVTLEELREAVGNKVVLDGIPMLLFMPEYDLSLLEAFTLEVLRAFAPRIILGISDELSPMCDVERVRFVSKLVEDWNSGQRR